LSILDVDQLVAPISDDAPCGEDLEYDPQFGELERAAIGKAAQVMGDEEIEAEPPDWSTVFSLSQELLGRSNDLRIAVLLTRAAVSKHGPAGLADGLEVFDRLIANNWDNVHPQLDPDDDYDPMLRLNSILGLSDTDGLVGDLLQLEVVASKAVGKFTLRDVRVANGDLSAFSWQENVPDSALINAAFMDADVDEMQANSDFIVKSIEFVESFSAAILERVGGAVAPNYSELTAELTEIRALYAEKLNARGVGVEMPGAVEGADGAGAAPAAGISGEVRSREDAIRMIDKICTYLEHAEPSSPVPMLLKRAKRLISMDYLEIMRDLTPDGVTQAESIGGVKADDGY
jgi:type VI secretion system protein ImpA